MKDVLPVIISILSLGVALFVAQRAWKFNDLSTRRASRETHAKMLFDLGKVLLDSPQLWGIYDTHALAVDRDNAPVAAAKRETFIYQHFNVFEMVRDYYTNVIRRDRVDEEYWQSWHCYMKQFFRSSGDARRLFLEPRTQEIYSRGYVEFTNQLIRESSVTPAQPAPPLATTVKAPV